MKKTILVERFSSGCPHTFRCLKAKSCRLAQRGERGKWPKGHVEWSSVLNGAKDLKKTRYCVARFVCGGFERKSHI